MGTDNELETWYVDANYRFKFNETQCTGTFRHTECLRAAPADHLIDNMCVHCRKIPKLPSFRKRLLRRKEERDSAKIRDEYLTHPERAEKLKNLRKESRDKDSQIFLLQQEKRRLQNRRQNLIFRLQRYSERGSMSTVCHQLNRAADEGKLKDENVLREVLTTCANNMLKKKQGKRYTKSVKEFYEVLMYWGGPRIASFVALNLHGPEVHSLYRWRKNESLHLSEGIAEANFVKIVDIYKNIMSSLGLSKVPVQISEDETAIIRKITYDQANDTLVGFCGSSVDNQCEENFLVRVGEGEDGYRNIVSAFENSIIGSYGRLIMINTLHPSLPNIPILVMPTCNTFTHKMVEEQLRKAYLYYEKHVESTLGPLVGPSSDGDSRRRKVFLSLMRIVGQNRFQPIDRELGFVLTCEKVPFDDGSYKIKNNCDQDSIHNHKKLVNHLDHNSRSMRMGNYLVHLNHVRDIYERYDFTEHGLLSTDINRDDKQNWRSAQRLSFKCIRTLMTHSNNIVNLGTKTYLEIVWMYVEIFHSVTASLYTRIVYASSVANFLAIWQNWVRMSPRITLKENFVSTQTYVDVILSCHSAVNLIIFMRDNYPGTECHLAEAGTDCCETMFSSMGQWVGNHHNYTLHDMLRNRSHQIRLEQLRTDPDGPKFARPHPKGESIWHKQCVQPFIKASLKDYPQHGEEVIAWKEGVLMAREMASRVGMKPDDDLPNDFPPFDDDHPCSSAIWFYKPFHFPKNTLNPSEKLSDDIYEEDDADSLNISTLTAFGEEIDCLPSAESLNNCEALNPPDAPVIESSKISPTVTIPETAKVIYKSKLVSMLNEDPKLSKDRLTRVRQRQEFSRKTGPKGVIHTGETVALSSEFAIVDRLQSSFLVGQVERIKYRGKDYTRPEPLNSVKKKDLTALMAVYRRADTQDNNEVKFKRNERTLRVIPFHDLLCEVVLTVSSEDHLSLDASDMTFLTALLRTRFGRTPEISAAAQNENNNSSADINVQSDGTVNMVVEPMACDSSSRRSKRTRRVRIGLS